MLKARTIGGHSPIFSAVEGGNQDVLRACLDICMNPFFKDRFNESPLYYAEVAQKIQWQFQNNTGNQESAAQNVEDLKLVMDKMKEEKDEYPEDWFEQAPEVEMNED